MEDSEKKTKYRINGFDQLKTLYSIVFSNKYDFTPQHISLYVFLINQNNRNNWVEWFKCPYDLAMAGSCIGSKKTYYKCLRDLQAWGLLKYEQGVNEWKAPKIRLEVLKCTGNDYVAVPVSEQVELPLQKQVMDPMVVSDINNKHKTQNPKPLIISETTEAVSSLHENFIKIHSDFYLKVTGVKYKFQGGADGKAIKNLINYIRKATEEKMGTATDQEILNGWRSILDKYDRWDPFFKSQLKIIQIESNLPNIIANIKGIRNNGQSNHQKQSARDIFDEISSIVKDSKSCLESE